MNPSPRPIPLLKPLRLDMGRVECLLNETLAKVEELLGSVLRRSLGRGERVRPALTGRRGQAGCLVPFVAIPDGWDWNGPASQTVSSVV